MLSQQLMSAKLKNQVASLNEDNWRLTASALGSQDSKGFELWSVSWAKKILKIFKTLYYLDKQKVTEPHMSKALKTFSKSLLQDVREISSSQGPGSSMLDGISMVNLDDASEMSAAQSALLGKGLETISELPSGKNSQPGEKASKRVASANRTKFDRKDGGYRPSIAESR